MATKKAADPNSFKAQATSPIRATLGVLGVNKPIPQRLDERDAKTVLQRFERRGASGGRK